MTSLHVRDLPENIHLKLQEEAKKENRSLAQQAVAVLAKGLDLEMNPKKRREDLLKLLKETPIINHKSTITDPVQFIREDRER
jgi:plasmid stability protein